MKQQTTTFNEIVESNFPTLDLYTTALTRAHGKSHPEVFEVRQLFEVISKKVKEAGKENPNLEVEFIRLRNITGNYNIPADACGTYVEVYEMLSEADKAYQAL